MPRQPKNVYVRNCNLSEGVFAQVLYYWWKGFSAKLAEQAIRESAPDGERHVSRETISRLYGEIGDHLWLLVPCDALVRAKVRDKNMSVEAAIAEIVTEQDFYFELLKKERTPHEVKLARQAFGVTWSPFSDRPIELLRLMFKDCNGFSRRRMNGYMTKALMLDRAMGADRSFDDAVEDVARKTLGVFKGYPMRAPLPLTKFPWIDHWHELNAKDQSQSQTGLE